MSIIQQTNNTQQSDHSTLGYYYSNNKYYSVLNRLNQRKTFQFLQDHFGQFKIEQVSPYNMLQMIKQQNCSQIDNHKGCAGFGSYGQVFYAGHVMGYPCVVKVQYFNQSEEFLQQLNEYKIQMILNKAFPQNFIQLVEKVTILQENMNSFISYAGLEIAMTTLDEYTKNVKIDFEEFSSIYHQVLRSILIMHSLKIAHRDIKPSNIMYVHNKGWVIGDFGCSIKYVKQKGIFKITGTTQFLPNKLRSLIKGQIQMEAYMNLFDNDIYAFLLTMLKVYYKDYTLYQSQTILDDQTSIKNLPVEFQILSKNFSQLQKFLDKNIKKIKIQQSFCQNKQKQIKSCFEEIQTQRDSLIPLLFNMYQFFNRPETKRYQQSIKNQAIKHEDLRIYIELMSPYFILKESTQLPQLTITTTYEQFQILFLYWFRLGNMEKQLQLCKQFQVLSIEKQFKVKLLELSILMFQENFNQADFLIQQLQDDEQNMDDITFLQLQIIKVIREKQWLECSEQFELWVKQNSTYLNYKEDWYFLMLGNFSWIYESSIIKHYITPKDYKLNDINKQENWVFTRPSTYLPRWIELCNWKGVDYLNSFQDMIKQLEQRGADIYGIKFFIQQLIRRIDMSDEQKKIINFFETSILYYENHFPSSNYFWELYFHYSQYCFSIRDYEKSMKFCCVALKFVDSENQYYQVMLEFMIISILSRQNSFDEQKIRSFKLLQSIFQIKSISSKSMLLKKFHSTLSFLFNNHQIQILELIFDDMSKYLEFEQNNQIIMQCLIYKFDFAYFIRNQNQMINFYYQMIPYYQSSYSFDSHVFSFFEKYTFVQKLTIQSESQKTQYLRDLGKFIQNLIIYDELIGLQQEDLSKIQCKQWQFLDGAQIAEKQQEFKQMAIQMQKYQKIKLYQDTKRIENLENVQINYK